MNKTIRKFLGYALFTWLALAAIAAAVIIDGGMICNYNNYQPVRWWGLFLFIIVPYNMICFCAVYSIIEDWEMLTDIFIDD